MNAAILELLTWLNVPLSGNAAHFVDPMIAWHGRLMVAAWLVVLPVSIIMARFYKVNPRQNWPKALDNPFWFIWHRRLAYLAIALTVAALAALLWARKESWFNAGSHAIAGWTVVLLTCAQIVSSLLRGTHGGPVDPFTRKLKPRGEWFGDHYCVTKRRVVFEYTHKIIGGIIVPIMLVAIVTGLWLADAPRWMWLGLVSICVIVIIVFIRLQRRGRCIDTYQAIWGLDPTLPGNLRKWPIGWGINRSQCTFERSAIFPE